MGLGDQLEKGQELDVGVRRVAGVGGDLAGGDLQRGEQTGRAVANVIVGVLLGKPWRSGRIGWGRSNAWIRDFSSTLTTTAVQLDQDRRGATRQNQT
jgi:hypothetical protein